MAPFTKRSFQAPFLPLIFAGVCAALASFVGCSAC